MKNILFEFYVAFAIILSIAPLGQFEVIAGIPDKYWSPEYSDAYTRDSLIPVMEPALKLFVSPDGNDEADGSKSRPFKTLEAARDAIRELKKKRSLPKGGINVILDGGRYHITRTFDIDSQDSGTMDAPVVYRGAEGEEVILTGGVPVNVSRFAIVTDPAVLGRLNKKARGRVMSVDLADSGLGKYFPGSGNYGLISMDGHLLQLARWPNRAYNHVGRFIDAGPTTRWLKPGEKPMPCSKEHPTGARFSFKEKLPTAIEKEFNYSGDICTEGYLHNDWYFQREPVGRITEDVVQLLRYTRYGVKDHIPSMPRRARLVNVLAVLDEPGEWYFDKKADRLFVWPIKGFAAGKSSVTILGGPGLVSIKDVQAVTFRNLIFENTGRIALEIESGHHNLVAACTFRNGIGRAVSISGGHHNGLTGCNVYGMGSLFSISGGDIRTITPCYNFATNNEFHDCRHRGYGIAGLKGVGIRFANNLLYNLNGGISFRTVNLLFEYNEFYNIGYEMGDFNPVYCGALWYTMNNVQRFNFIHHMIEPGGYPVGAFRNDDGGAGLHIYGNVLYRAGRYACGFAGPANHFQNNISIDMSVMWWTLKGVKTAKDIQSRWDELAKFGRDLPHGDKGDYLFQVEQVLGKQGWQREPWKSAFPVMDTFIRDNPWSTSYCNVNTNYYNSIRELTHVHGGRSDMAVEDSRDKLEDLPETCNYVSPTPIDLDAFVDLSTLNFNFRPSFKPMKGFRPIPFDKIGLHVDQFRKTAPDKDAYRRAIYEKYKNDRTKRYDPEAVSKRYPLPTYIR